jgi:hypothetical protein
LRHPLDHGRGDPTTELVVGGEGLRGGGVTARQAFPERVVGRDPGAAGLPVEGGWVGFLPLVREVSVPRGVRFPGVKVRLWMVNRPARILILQSQTDRGSSARSCSG